MSAQRDSFQRVLHKSSNGDWNRESTAFGRPTYSLNHMNQPSSTGRLPAQGRPRPSMLPAIHTPFDRERTPTNLAEAEMPGHDEEDAAGHGIRQRKRPRLSGRSARSEFMVQSVEDGGSSHDKMNVDLPHLPDFDEF